MAGRRLTWVPTTGGPHLVVAEKHAPHWEGAGAPTRRRVVEAKFRWDTSGPATDYDRACDVVGPLGVVRVGRGRGVVLGDDPNDAAYYPYQGRHFVLRWVFAPSEATLVDFFQTVLPGLAVRTGVSIRHPGGRLVLLDASDTPRSWLGEHSEFELPAGQYRVSAMGRETDGCAFLAHEWRRVRA